MKTKRVLVNTNSIYVKATYALLGDLFVQTNQDGRKVVGGRFAPRPEFKQAIREANANGTGGSFRYYQGTGRYDKNLLPNSFGGFSIGCNAFDYKTSVTIAEWAGLASNSYSKLLVAPKVKSNRKAKAARA